MVDRRERSRERLQQAALELFTLDGYAETTAVAIAERAGVTERTFYRHFGDKREVLFGDGDRLVRLLVDALPHPPEPPGQALRSALSALATDMTPRRERLARRAAVVKAHHELAERELLKLQSWAQALARVLIDRGIDELTAVAQVEVALALFRTAFTRWVTSDDDAADLECMIDRAYAAAGLPLNGRREPK
ncbi:MULTISPECIES: TetR/AcrR family transcriptional regulator [Amycolatopsis]|uniref:TetR/AcrR family transcriptional regulator n=1 Tax=Amycolatopsis tucumanensis TaxID=401106 RepID=A0ABP7HD23_9PSEU|nr:TetR/AcrR family transcriptional regulator [Amycolatopsis tucumanensis]MCF6421470.1 TetR/AcrR family transcriptional regulator [Amycolatopsis tucumanensis]